MGAAERARLARAARALLGGDAEVRRAVGLGVGASRPSLSFAELAAVPDWLPAESTRRARLLVAAGLAARAPELSRTLDGASLRPLADAVGAELLDWALTIGRADDAPTPGPALDGDPATIGEAVVRASLPDALAPWFAGGPQLPRARAEWALARACEAAG